MDTLTNQQSDFWRGMLAGGGLTTIPRWTMDPHPGIGQHIVDIPADLVEILCRLADSLKMPLNSVLLAAHAKVLATLAGEKEIVTGYVTAPGRAPLPCRLTIGPFSWRALLASVDRVEREMRWQVENAGSADPLAGFQELDPGQPIFESVLDPWDALASPAESTVLQVAISHDGSGARLRLLYRTDVLDAPAAARVAGYHLSALEAIAANPDADHAR